MFKMKSALYIVAIFSLALVSCTDRLPVAGMPEDIEKGNGAITMISATVKPLYVQGLTGVGKYKWGEHQTLGIIPTNGENVQYLPVKSTTGDSEAFFYGNEVGKGDGSELSIYMPYSNENGAKAKDGRLSMLSEQVYYSNAFDHLMYNSTFLATTTSTNVEFDYYAGLLQVAVTYDINNIKAVKVVVGNIDTNGNYNAFVSGDYSIADESLSNDESCQDYVTVNVKEEGVNATIDKPLTVWVALAPGTYENFVIILNGEDSNGNATSVTIPVKGEKVNANGEKEASPFVIERCALASQVCVAKKVYYNNGVDDLLPEEGEFNE